MWKGYIQKINMIIRLITMSIILLVGVLLIDDTVQAKTNDYVIEDGVLKKYNGNEEQIILPSEITTIDKGAFQGNTKIREVLIPDSVTRILYGAFENCSSLESIKLPDSVTYLGNNVFKNCRNLKNIRLSENITSIGDSAFMGCTSLESIQIPDGVINIGWYAFLNCSNLTDIIIPESVIYFGALSFDGTVWLEERDEDWVIINHALIKYQGSDTSVTIPEGVNILEDGCFHGNSYIQEVNIPDGVTRIECGAFYDCTSLTKIIIPNTVTLIGTDAFRGCSSLENIDIPDSVTDIAPNILTGTKFIDNYQNDFLQFNNILIEYLGDAATVVIPDNIKKIGTYTFYKNDSVVDIIIPEGVTELEDRIAFRCKNLKSIRIPASVVSIGNELALENNDDFTVYGIVGSKAEEYADVNGIPFLGISINKSKATLYYGGTVNSITLTIAGNTEEVQWKSSNHKVATVSASGVVTAIAKGSAVVYVDIDGLIAACKITVKEPYISSKTLTLKAGSSYNLTIKGISSGIIWSSSKSSVVKVSQTGRITAVKTGTAIITAKVNGKTYTCKITVKSKGEIKPFQ